MYQLDSKMQIYFEIFKKLSNENNYFTCDFYIMSKECAPYHTCSNLLYPFVKQPIFPQINGKMSLFSVKCSSSHCEHLFDISIFIEHN